MVRSPVAGAGAELKTFAARVVASVAGIVCVAAWLIGMTRERWGTRLPDATHPYQINFRGPADLYFEPRLGWFLDHSIWIFFVLLIAAAAIDWAYDVKSTVGRERINAAFGKASAAKALSRPCLSPKKCWASWPKSPMR